MNRSQQYYDLSTKLSLIDNVNLGGMLDDGDLGKGGWGSNHIIKIGKSKVFAKKIPLTKVEFDNAFSTKNHYDLPMVYNYGIGSAGFGAYRELLLHIKSTNWVLSKACQNFPLLYHYRLLRRTDKTDINRKRHNNYIKYWGGDKNISKYIKARYHAPYELVLCLEYIPETFDQYVRKNKKTVVKLASQVLNTISFLKCEKIIHLDMHFSNILTDGVRPYVTDFGLGLDKSFDLSKDEKKFFARHVNYDYGEFICCMASFIMNEVAELSKAKKTKAIKIADLKEEDSENEELRKILFSIEALQASGLINLPKSYRDFLEAHKHTILHVNAFFEAAFESQERDKLYAGAKLKRLLSEAGVIV